MVASSSPAFASRSALRSVVFAVLISFATFALYTAYAPFIADDNDVLSLVCHTQIFLTILMRIILMVGDPPPLLLLTCTMYDVGCTMLRCRMYDVRCTM